ncbi:GspE/PulE family protein [Campylobacter sp. LR286c]|uniref:GspE/PulE family protein n=1 Tax=Campylobacter sp. LR286c TaxID=2593545 RepID=UPI00123824B4|nr:GspE/PulE family protein [Campylobacter sp. LR286c]KAA6228042.1 type II/IV secretion system protein [Campylobacter sp. LR286c]
MSLKNKFSNFKKEELSLENDKFFTFLKENYLAKNLDLNELLELNIKNEDFLKVFARSLNMEFMDFERVDENLCAKMPTSFMQELEFVPLKADETNIYILCVKNFNLENLERIQSFFMDKILKLYISDSFKIHKILKELAIKEKLEILSFKLKEEWEKGLKEEQSFVSQIFDFIIKEALNLKASDIHIEGLENGALIRFRIDGVLSFFCHLQKEVYTALVFYIKHLSHLNVAQQRKAQDGSFELKIEDKKYDFRISTLPLLYGESVVMRILRHDEIFLSLDNLHFDEFNLTLLKKAIASPHGMILLTGPTGSGKSTTLYACLNALKSIEKKIITAEDPIEYKMSLVQQIALNSKAGLDFNNALRAILRQDPDIIMIGEIRDEESLDIAIKASLTGHLLLSTLHTNDALSAIDRLLNMNANPYLIAHSLNLIIAQRLVRKLCNYCKTKVFNDEFKDYFYEPSGCIRCNKTGFLGRELVAEVLFIDENLSKLILNLSSKKELLEQARKNGFKTMFELGLIKARQGIISINELLRVIK